jgi:hypothetical protein
MTTKTILKKNIMNTVGRVQFNEENKYLTPEEIINKSKGNLISFTQFEKNNEFIKFRSDSHIYYSFWAEGSINISDIDKDGFTNKHYKINGRSNDNGKSQLYASINGWKLRLDDIENPPFWAECRIPIEYQIP